MPAILVSLITSSVDVVRARQDSRWLSLLNISDNILNLATRTSVQNRRRLIERAESNLSALLEVFSRDIDPVSDLEGFAVRRLSRSFLALVDSLQDAEDSLGARNSQDAEGGTNWRMVKSVKLPKTIYITETDKARLESLVAGFENPSANVEALEDELSRAVVVPSREVPADVVTMNSRIRFQDMTSGEETEVTVTYPHEADVDRGRLSVLAPVGTALLGLRVGDEIEWPLPSGKTRMLKIVSILFQPEAAGQFNM